MPQLRGNEPILGLNISHRVSSETWSHGRTVLAHAPLDV
jgi:hypothetical protein